MFALRSLHSSQYLFWITIGFMLGAGLVPVIWLVGVLLVVAIYYRWKSTKLFGVIILLLLVVGAWWLGGERYTQYQQQQTGAAIVGKQTVVGVITRPPRIKVDEQIIDVATDQHVGLRVTVPRWPEYRYGQIVEVTCNIQEPKSDAEFNYEAYLARYKLQATCQNADVEVLAEERTWLSGLYELRWWLQQRIVQLWPEPAASVMAGILIGVQDGMPDRLQEAFRISGTIHVLVVSGMHVAIIVQLLSSSLQRWFMPRTRLLIIIATVFGLAVVTGLQASVIRAGIMGMVPLIAYILGRPQTMHVSLSVIAASMIAVNPFILLHDMGFQLSFLATLGLIYYQPLVQPWLRWVPERFTLQETAATTIAATIPTTPLIWYVFGDIATLGIPMNLIIVPITNLLLFAGFGIVTLSLFSVNAAMYVAMPLTWLSNMVVWLVEQVSSIPWA